MRLRRLFAVSAAGLCAATLMACSSGPSTPSSRYAAKIRANPMPELVTLYQRQVDVDNTLAVMANENERMFMQDLGRVFYTDRPSRLTREPIPW
ncbi:MAG: hypothetical protein DYG93_09715 [Leptolyngbya sp. PLA2]|nr:MAG: hypothetical protein EDM76_12665 [bacterium]MBC6952831.1 hypothetical protein [Leptolyngbya sp.]MCE7971920.1 hypothetical protein [Leptolyngbya sp. PL-A2]MCQ3939716.1 hypothetical protein [cyanobacterium CYA1]MCZ7632036.1 hypothetical protein [Phycisphaerales bacterium]MDL1903972.1 hypothetical protein [Synechococcales cyanobacterium CNB]GIK18735.1 MAG: hypothetical protein BroJett004_08990 [Planctomycetota bacterium]